MNVLQRVHSLGEPALSVEGSVYWKCVGCAILWTLWVERNKRIFDEEDRDWVRVVNAVKELVWRWNIGNEGVRGIRLDMLIANWSAIIRG
ncbi:hypothetical protein ACHQM5_001404 [Ranunculus cassubicifolius]